MHDLISRRTALKTLCDNCEHVTAVCAHYPCKQCVEMENLPSAQPEIIRCKDCKYCEHWYADKGRCFLWHETGIDVFKDGYCSYAERRTDG